MISIRKERRASIFYEVVSDPCVYFGKPEDFFIQGDKEPISDNLSLDWLMVCYFYTFKDPRKESREHTYVVKQVESRNSFVGLFAVSPGVVGGDMLRYLIRSLTSFIWSY